MSGSSSALPSASASVEAPEDVGAGAGRTETRGTAVFFGGASRSGSAVDAVFGADRPAAGSDVEAGVRIELDESRADVRSRSTGPPPWFVDALATSWGGVVVLGLRSATTGGADEVVAVVGRVRGVRGRVTGSSDLVVGVRSEFEAGRAVVVASSVADATCWSSAGVVNHHQPVPTIATRRRRRSQRPGRRRLRRLM